MCWPLTRVCLAGLMWAPRFSFLRSLVQLGASDNGKNVAQKTIAFVSLLPAVVSRTYEACGIWLQIRNEMYFTWRYFHVNALFGSLSLYMCCLKTSQSKISIPVQTFKNPWNCLKSAVLTFLVVTRCWRPIKGLFQFHIASGQTTKHWRHCLFAISFLNKLIISMSKGA